MTVVGATLAPLGPRKAACRCIPEIHVTRLSASSSLRPKLGLLLLLLVLLASLAAVAVPTLTALLLPLVREGRERPGLAPKGTFEERLWGAVGGEGGVVVSPWAVRASLGDLARWAGGATRQQLLEGAPCTNCSLAAGGAVGGVLLVPGMGAKELEGVVRMDYRVEEARAQVGAWLRSHGAPGAADWGAEHTTNSQVMLVTAATTNLVLGTAVEGEWRGREGGVERVRMGRVVGDYLVGKVGDTTVVEVGVGDGQSLCLILPHLPTSPPLHGGECSAPHLQRARVAVVLPQGSTSSHLSLSFPLTSMHLGEMFSEGADLSTLSTQQGLRVGEVLHAATLSILPATEQVVEGKEVAEVREVVVDRPFSFLVRQRSTNRTLLMGSVEEKLHQTQ